MNKKLIGLLLVLTMIFSGCTLLGRTAKVTKQVKPCLTNQITGEKQP